MKTLKYFLLKKRSAAAIDHRRLHIAIPLYGAEDTRFRFYQTLQKWSAV